MTGRYVHTIWCDDIRQEVGNKPSFMGVYTGGIVLAQLPAVLPRLGVFTWFSTPIDQQFRQLVLRVVRDDGQVLVEMTPEAMPPAAAAEAAARIEVTRTMVAVGLSISPVEIPAGCRYFQVIVEVDGSAEEGPKLHVEVNPEAVALLNPGMRVAPKEVAEVDLEAPAPSSST